MMRLRPCFVHGLDGSSHSKALSSQGPRAFSFRLPQCDQRQADFARGAFAADGVAAKASGDHVPVIAVAFGRSLSLLDIQRRVVC